MPGNRSVDEPARKIFIKDLDTLDTNRLIWIQGYITDVRLFLIYI